MSQALTAAILVVSTTAAQDPSTDASTTALTNVFNDEGDGKWTVVESKIVTDDVVAIQRQVSAWASQADAPNLIISTGGTGFAVSDKTPEVSLLNGDALDHLTEDSMIKQAVTPLLDKQAPGLVHAMLSSSLQVTPCKCLPA